MLFERMSYIRKVYRYPILSTTTCGSRPRSQMYRARASFGLSRSGKMGKKRRCDAMRENVELDRTSTEASEAGARSLDRSGRLFAQLPRYHDVGFSKRAPRQRAAGSFPSDERYHVIFYPQIPPYPDVSP